MNRAQNTVDCCTFEVEVKGVMFYEGQLKLDSAKFQRILIARDYNTQYDSTAYWVKLAENELKLGHLSRNTAKAWHYISKMPTVQYYG